jgi:excinuclease ABC subunit C
LGNCEGPCEFKDAQERYSKHVATLEEVLKGKNQTKIFTKKLKEEMYQAAKLQQFERAKDIRDTLIRLDSLQSKQKMEYIKNSDEEYFGIGIQEQVATVMNFRMINGVIRDSDKFFFDLVGDNSFPNFLYQYYSTHKIPKFIILSELPENQKLLELLFSEQSGFSVKILSPNKGKRKDILNLILKNIELIHSKGGDLGLVELKEILKLSVIPNIIECFDISNHGDDFAVGSMARFVGGIPNKSGYRKFKIKTVSGRDDFAMIGEIIKRRYYRLLEENAELPDLIVIDGGKGQLTAALKSLESLGLKLPCISLAKENEEVFVPKSKNPIVIPKNKPSLKILQYARDETHRFGVAYNRNIRKNQIK